MGSGKGGSQQDSAGAAQAAIAQQLFRESTSLRRGIIGELEGVLGFPATDFAAQPNLSTGGGFFGRWPIAALQQAPQQATTSGVPARPTGILSGAFRPAREAIESQANVAREQVLGSVPARGGQLNQLLTDVAVDRARSVSGLESAMLNRAFDVATGLSTGMPGLALSGLGSAGALQAGAADRAFRQQQAMGAGLGTALGTGLGFALGGPQGALIGGKAGGGAGGAAGGK